MDVRIVFICTHILLNYSFCAFPLCLGSCLFWCCCFWWNICIFGWWGYNFFSCWVNMLWRLPPIRITHKVRILKFECILLLSTLIPHITLSCSPNNLNIMSLYSGLGPINIVFRLLINSTFRCLAPFVFRVSDCWDFVRHKCFHRVLRLVSLCDIVVRLSFDFWLFWRHIRKDLFSFYALSNLSALACEVMLLIFRAQINFSMPNDFSPWFDFGPSAHWSLNCFVAAVLNCKQFGFTAFINDAVVSLKVLIVQLQKTVISA